MGISEMIPPETEKENDHRAQLCHCWYPEDSLAYLRHTYSAVPCCYVYNSQEPTKRRLDNETGPSTHDGISAVKRDGICRK